MNYNDYDDDRDDNYEDYEEELELELDVPDEQRPQPTLDETLDALRQGEVTGLTAVVYYGLTDLAADDLLSVRMVWEGLSPDYRAKVCQQLVDVSEMNFELDYREFALMALEDSDAEVRAAAVELMWTDETVQGMQRLIELALEDEAVPVRAVAVGALGRYILLGEYGDLPEDQTSTAVDVAFSIYRDDAEEIEVRRRALEALGNSSHEAVNESIREAYNSQERLLKVSAVYAMGRTADERWASSIMRELNSGDAEMRYEAVRAVGELGLEDAVPKLSRLVHEPDRDIQEVAIWALGEIGSKEAQRVLRRLLDDPAYAIDEALIESLEDAMVSASLPGSDLLMFEVDEEDELEDDEDLFNEPDFLDELDDDPNDKSRWN